jgi:phthalate 4,5-dioxygenase
VLYRRLLLDAIRKNEAGERPLMVLDAAKASELTGPPAIDGIGPTGAMDEYWRRADENRRRQARWSQQAA